MSTDERIRLRYTGTHATTFQRPGVGHLQPGDEFDVPAEAVLAFMRRADIEHVGECPAPPCRCGEEPEHQAAESGISGKPKGGRRRGAASTQDGQDGPVTL